MSAEETFAAFSSLDANKDDLISYREFMEVRQFVVVVVVVVLVSKSIPACMRHYFY